MEYYDIPLDTKTLLESIDLCIKEKDYLKTYLFLTSYGEMKVMKKIKNY